MPALLLLVCDAIVFSDTPEEKRWATKLRVHFMRICCIDHHSLHSKPSYLKYGTVVQEGKGKSPVMPSAATNIIYCFQLVLAANHANAACYTCNHPGKRIAIWERTDQVIGTPLQLSEHTLVLWCTGLSPLYLCAWPASQM